MSNMLAFGKYPRRPKRIAKDRIMTARVSDDGKYVGLVYQKQEGASVITTRITLSWEALAATHALLLEMDKPEVKLSKRRG